MRERQRGPTQRCEVRCRRPPHTGDLQVLPGAVHSSERWVTPAAVAARVAYCGGDSTFWRLDARVSGNSPGWREGGTDMPLGLAQKGSPVESRQP